MIGRTGPPRLAGPTLLGALLALGAGPARAQEPLSAKLGCEPGRAPGRELCTLEVSAPPGRRLTWADALVLETPSFARALRTRVAAKEPGSPVRLTLALVLEAPGRGSLRVRARTVLCEKAGTKERCSPVTRDVEAELVAAK